jgi:hypothetical protein
MLHARYCLMKVQQCNLVGARRAGPPVDIPRRAPAPIGVWQSLFDAHGAALELDRIGHLFSEVTGRRLGIGQAVNSCMLRAVSATSMEDRARQARRRDRARHHRVPLPAGDLEVEQDRTPHVQLHHHELARPAAHLLPHHRRARRRDHHRVRPQDSSRSRRGLLPPRHPHHRPGTRRCSLTPHQWHGDWNYTIKPHHPRG